MLTVIRSNRAAPSILGTETFTGGSVWRDALMSGSDGVTLGQVLFSPGARTHWHTHEDGQVLIMVAGEGIVADSDGAVRVRTGDIVWTPGGVRHWHGAAAGNFLIHTTISLGSVEWDEAVPDVDYLRAVAVGVE
jgi:quercetin dioxygenase-like cupin family protein